MKTIKVNYYDKARVWDFIIDAEIATEDELKSITDINGYSVETLNDVIYDRTRYRNVEEILKNSK